MKKTKKKLNLFSQNGYYKRPYSFYTSPFSSHVYFLTKHSKIFTFGAGSHGQLCAGHYLLHTRFPVEVGKKFIGKGKLTFDVVINNMHYDMVKKDICIVKVSVGLEHTLFLSSKGSVYSVGNNKYGQLCTGDLGSDSNPLLIESIKHEITDIFCGYWCSFFKTRDGKVLACGSNSSYKLGIKKTAQKITEPYQVHLPSNEILKDVSPGGSLCAFVFTSGSVYVSGYLMRYGSLTSANGVSSFYSKVPIKLKINDIITRICTGENNIIAISISGNVWGYGNNNSKIMGDLEGKDPQDKFIIASPKQIKIFQFKSLENENEVVDVRIGRTHSLFLLRNGDAYGVGFKKYLCEKISEDEIFSEENMKNYITKPKLLKQNVEQICIGLNCNYFITFDKSVYVNGSKEFGKLGLQGDHDLDTMQYKIVKNELISKSLKYEYESCAIEFKTQFTESPYFDCHIFTQ